MAERLELAGQVSWLCRLILNVRLAVLLLTILWVGRDAAENPLVPVAITLTAVASFLPLWYWDRLSSSLLSNPTFIGLDVVVAIGLLSLTGAEGPAVHFALTTSALSGLLRGWRGAAFVSVMLVAGYQLVLGVQGVFADATFQILIGTPALYPMAAGAGASVRVLLDRQAATEAALAEAIQTAAAADERTRLAREMHDSLAKTLQGIALTASALQRAAVRDPGQAATLAGSVAEAAKVAAGEARELISDLRDDRLDVSLDDAVRTYVTGWSERVGVPTLVEAKLNEGTTLAPACRHELFAILKEGLHNVERHAAASSVKVVLGEDREWIRIAVVDDGVGFEQPADIADLARRGSYGLIGMAERAQRVGGRLEVRAAPEAGVRIDVRAPKSRPHSQIPNGPAGPLLRGLTA